MLRKRKCFVISLFIIALTYLSASNSYAVTALEYTTAAVTIGNGARLDIGNSTLNASNIAINGELEATTGTINVSGHWINNGSFLSGTGTVNFIDGVSPAYITGDSQFYNFSATTSGGKTLVYEADTTQTVVNYLTLLGDSAHILVLVSDTPGLRARINLQAGATQLISYVDVSGQEATGQGIAPGMPGDFFSVDSGGNLFWFDSDGDGLSFNDEIDNGTNPDNPDSDGDGLSDSDEVLVYLTDPNNADSDNDGLSDWDEIFVYSTNPNSPDPDDDGDGVVNIVDNCLGVSNPDQADNDGDNDGDICDPDDDQDSILDEDDNCQFAWNFEQINSDLDSFGDLCDNCPKVDNPGQSDTDGDGFGDVCGPDYGAGGKPVKNSDPPADPDYLDSDKDGLSNGMEDTNGNGVVDAGETDPNDSDSDNDGISDGANEDLLSENDQNNNIAIYAGPDNCNDSANPDFDQIDTDDDGVGDPCDIDDDGDGWNDGVDNCPLVANASQSNIDGDLDGDACDADADGDGYFSVASGLCTIGVDCDCNDLNENVKPGWSADVSPVDTLEDTAWSENQLDDDCNPLTLDSSEWAIEFVLEDQDSNTILDLSLLIPIDNLDTWEPTDGDNDGSRVTIIADVTNILGNTTPPFQKEGAFTFDITFDSDGDLVDDRNVTNYQGRYMNDTSTTTEDDFGIDDVTPDFPYTGIGTGNNKITLIPRDYGGSIKIKASVWIKIDDDNNGFDPDDPERLLSKVITLPEDSDNDGLPDFWENLYGDLLPGDDLETSLGNGFVGDDFTNLEECRGFVWNPRADQAVIDPPSADYQTRAYIPNGVVKHFRTNPNRKDLFVMYHGFGGDSPYAHGAAFEVAGIDVHALDASVASYNGLSETSATKFDVLNITNDTVNVYSGSGHIRKSTGRRSYRQWNFSRKGMCDNLGNEDFYATNCKLFEKATKFYFEDVPILDLGGVDMAGQPDPNPDGVLNPLVLNGTNIVEDQDDDGELDGGEDNIVNNNQLDGDHYVLPPTFDAFPGLSVFNIDGDSGPIMVELPLFTDPTDEELNDHDYSRPQVTKHTITHELGHGVGCDHNLNGGTCMYEFSNSWDRDGSFSPLALEQIQIHNSLLVQ